MQTGQCDSQKSASVNFMIFPFRDKVSHLWTMAQHSSCFSRCPLTRQSYSGSMSPRTACRCSRHIHQVPTATVCRPSPSSVARILFQFFPFILSARSRAHLGSGSRTGSASLPPIVGNALTAFSAYGRHDLLFSVLRRDAAAASCIIGTKRLASAFNCLRVISSSVLPNAASASSDAP